MRRRDLALALAGLVGLGGSVFADDGHIALVKSVNGSVKVTRHQVTFEASAGMVLLVSDQLVSSPGSSAAMVFRDGTLLTLGSSADMLVRDYLFEPKDAKYAFGVYLAKGSAIYSSGKIGKLAPQSVKVDTPTATVGVRGTRFLIEAN